jgi:hypothetical protein
MSELTLEAVEQLLVKQTKTLTAQVEASAEELAEMVQFLTKEAAHKEDLRDLSEHLDKKFSEQAVSLNFIESQLATLRKDLDHLSKRTKEDDSAFVKELLKLKNRIDSLEKQVKKFKPVHA